MIDYEIPLTLFLQLQPVSSSDVSLSPNSATALSLDTGVGESSHLDNRDNHACAAEVYVSAGLFVNFENAVFTVSHFLHVFEGTIGNVSSVLNVFGRGESRDSVPVAARKAG